MVFGKNNSFMKSNKYKNVSKSEIKNSLIQSLEYNSKALDYLENEINRVEGLLKYDPGNKEIMDLLSILQYIQFSLKYLDTSYNTSLKKVGGF